MRLTGARRSANWGNVAVQGGESYDADAAAYFAAMSTPPTTAFKNATNTLIVDLKANSLWTKLDWWCNLAAESLQAALLNMADPAKTLAEVGGGGTFTAGSGWAGDGSASYLTLGETFDSGAQFSQDSAHVAAGCNQQNGASGNRVHVSDLAATFFRVALNAAGNSAAPTFRVNDASSTAGPTYSTRAGYRVASRRDSANKELYRDGASVQDSAVASTGVSAGNGSLLYRPASTEFCADRLYLFHSGGAISDAEAATLETLVSAYCTALSIPRS